MCIIVAIVTILITVVLKTNDEVNEQTINVKVNSQCEVDNVRNKINETTNNGNCVQRMKEDVDTTICEVNKVKSNVSNDSICLQGDNEVITKNTEVFYEVNSQESLTTVLKYEVVSEGLKMSMIFHYDVDVVKDHVYTYDIEYECRDRVVTENSTRNISIDVVCVIMIDRCHETKRNVKMLLQRKLENWLPRSSQVHRRCKCTEHVVNSCVNSRVADNGLVDELRVAMVGPRVLSLSHMNDVVGIILHRTTIMLFSC